MLSGKLSEFCCLLLSSRLTHDVRSDTVIQSESFLPSPLEPRTLPSFLGLAHIVLSSGNSMALHSLPPAGAGVATCAVAGDASAQPHRSAGSCSGDGGARVAFCSKAPLPSSHRVHTHEATGTCTKRLSAAPGASFCPISPHSTNTSLLRLLAELLPPTSGCPSEHNFVSPAISHCLSMKFPLIPISAGSKTVMALN